jgi:hypothetical protein
MIPSSEHVVLSRVPPLRNGDRLTREEFYRRWEAMQGLKHAERLGGVVSMAAAVRRKHHGAPHSIFVTWLGLYAWETPGTESGDNSSAVFPGLWLDPTAMIGGDLKRVLRVLRKGLRSPEHARFLRRLGIERQQSGAGR